MYKSCEYCGNSIKVSETKKQRTGIGVIEIPVTKYKCCIEIASNATAGIECEGVVDENSRVSIKYRTRGADCPYPDAFKEK